MTWASVWRIARRDLNRNLRGLRLLFLCLLLGVGTLAAIGSLTASITSELAMRGQGLLGGDLEAALSQREATPTELAALAARGTVSTTIRMRAMAQRDGTADAADNAPAATLSELKGVDAAYPLYGTLTLASGPLATPLAADEAVIGTALADRLNLKKGDVLRFGTASFTVRDTIANEPDRVGEGFTLGPVAIVSVDGMRRTGLLQPGSLYNSKYRVKLPPATRADADTRAMADAIKDQFPSAGWEVKTRDNAAPGANRFIERMGQFLSLIGLSALVIAGIGVSNGVSSYLSAKRKSIATLKVLGASSGDIMRLYLMQIAAVALPAIALGLVIGALLPSAIVAVAGDVLPVQPGFALHPLPLATSAAYGVLVALIFALPPLARARTEPAAALFRDVVQTRGGVDRRTLGWVGGAIVLALALAIGTAREPLFSAIVLLAVGAVLLLLLGIGDAVRRLAKRMPRAQRPLLRLAIANLHRPGAQTQALVIALGLALTLFVTLAAIQTSLNSEIKRVVPVEAPDQFMLDIPAEARTQYSALVESNAAGAKVNIVPALRGTIIAYAGTRVADLAELPEGAWFLRGERGITYSPVLPEGSDLTAGTWWAKDYAGPPLVSLDEEAAATLGVGVGDVMTVSILGREIEARIASLRRVNWDTMGFNYIMVFSPSALKTAPHTLAASVTLGENKAALGAVSRAVLAAFPSVSIIAVGDVVAQVGTLLDQMASAILAAASVAILAGIAVLVGAIAASRQVRAYDSVILKVLGANRWQVLGMQLLEYALLSAVLTLVALGLGSLAAWYVIVQLFDFTWAPDWAVVLGTLAGGAALTLGIGMAGSIPLMAVRPAQALREL